MSKTIKLFCYSTSLLFAMSVCFSQTYEWKEVGKYDIKLHPFFSFFHLDSTNRLYVCTEWSFAQFAYSDNDGKTWHTKSDSSLMKDYFGFAIGLDSNGIIGQFQISEFGKNMYTVPNPQQWFTERMNYLKTNKNPWIKISKSNKIFLPTIIVLTSSDSGKYWKKNDILNGRPEGYFYWTDSMWSHYQKQYTTSILVDQYNRIIVSSKAGVYISENDGAFWKSQNHGLTDSSIKMIRMRTDGGMYAISDSGLIFKGTITPNYLDRDKRFSSISKNLLFQNYPNPFNPSTAIDFTILQDDVVTLSIYDVLGAEVEVIIHEKLSQGVHSVVWNAKNLPSGLYFYRIQSGRYTETRKMILLR